MKKKLLILDGTSLLAEAYYKTLTKEVEQITSLKESGKVISKKEEDEAFATLLQSKKGTYINGVQGFFKTLFDALDKRKPSHVAIVWGAQRENNFRRKIFPGYKDDGKVKDRALLEQEKMVKKMLHNMRIYQLESLEYEALDLAGSLAEKFKNEADIEILARNTMSLQFTDIATVWFKTPNHEDIIRKHNLDRYDYPNGAVKFDRDFLLTYKKLTPEQMPDYRALIGNSFSKIPGVKSVGEVTTSALLEEYGSIEAIYSDIDACTTQAEIVDFGKSLMKYLTLPFNPIPFLVKGKEEALLGKDLATYRRDVLGKELKDSDKLSVNDLDNNKINRVEIVKELKSIGLSPIRGNITKNIAEVIEDVGFSSLISTYNPLVFSPNSSVFVGNSYFLDSIPVEIEQEGEMVTLIHLTDEAIVKFGDKIKINTANTNYYSDKAVRERLEEQEKAQSERQVAIITSLANQEKEVDEDISTQIVWATSDNTQIKSNEDYQEEDFEESNDEESNDEEYEGHEECDEYEGCEDEEINKSTKDSENPSSANVKATASSDTTPNSDVNAPDESIDNSPGVKNSNSTVESKSTKKKKGLSLIESIVINRYYCSQCNEEFTLVGSEASFCTKCGASTVDGNDKVDSEKKDDNEQVEIPIAEKSNCKLDDLKLKECKNSLEGVIIAGLS